MFITNIKRMADFITLTCPTCGEKQGIIPNTVSIKCNHCGNEHTVRQEEGNFILEAYVRCPICGRNDKSEKLSAINSHGGLSPPHQPVKKEGFGFITWLFIGYGLIIVSFLPAGIIIGVVNAFNVLSDQFYFIGIITGLVFFVFLLGLVRRYNNDQITRAEEEFESEMEIWNEIMSLWERLYYCKRDDKLFDPKTNDLCEPLELEDFIFSNVSHIRT